MFSYIQYSDNYCTAGRQNLTIGAGRQILSNLIAVFTLFHIKHKRDITYFSSVYYRCSSFLVLLYTLPKHLQPDRLFLQDLNTRRTHNIILEIIMTIRWLLNVKSGRIAPQHLVHGKIIFIHFPVCTTHTLFRTAHRC